MATKRFERVRDYDLRLYEKPYASTIALEKFLEKHGCFSGRIMDLASGFGPVAHYFAKKHPKAEFVGVDYNEYYVEVAKGMECNKGMNNLSYEAADWMELPAKYRGKFDGVFSCHALCCFKDVEKPIDEIVKLGPKWVAFNSLFYEGPLDALVHIRDHSDPTVDDNSHDADFNIFSLQRTQEIFKKHGYTEFVFERFEMPFALPRPAGGARGTYTMATEISPRTQFSGPVYLPWHFVLARRKQ